MSATGSLCECARLKAERVASLEANVDQKYLTSSDYVRAEKYAVSLCPVHGDKHGT